MPTSHKYFMSTPFLPLTIKEARERGWDAIDIVLITGDAYVDHPSFGTAVIGRILEAQGYRVGIIAMPDWTDPASVAVFGRPRLFFGVTSGNVDSMLARYTAFKRYRSDDPYVPGGNAGRKPERAILTYCNLLKAAYKDVPIVIGGVEASMRRMAHYDFWSNKVRRSILEDSRADILVYGMGEQAILEIAERYLNINKLTPRPPLLQREGEKTEVSPSLLPPLSLQERGPGGEFFLKPTVSPSFTHLPGTVTLVREVPEGAAHLLPSEEDVLTSKAAFSEFYRQLYRNQAQVMAQPTGKRWLLHVPPAAIATAELDAIYELPFQRRPHPSYTAPIPAFEMIKHSVTAHRGCVSGCSFCSLGLHQGKRIVSRSPESVLKEVTRIAQQPDFTGFITDIGGPSANMYGFECRRDWHCTRESCLFPALCPNLNIATADWLKLLQQAARLYNVKKVTIGSGMRYDLLMRDPEHVRILRDLLANHISGQLKIAPEHTSSVALRAMRKTPLAGLDNFVTLFRQLTARQGKEQFPLPYLMSGHPGSTVPDMHAMLAEVQRIFQYVPHQVQSFIPLPMTLSSVIYYTGADPLTGERFPVVQDMQERRAQHDVFFQRRAARSASGKTRNRHHSGKRNP